MRSGLFALAVVLVLAGCGEAEPTVVATVEEPERPSLETRVNVGALGFALEDYRSAADAFIEQTNSCVDLARLGADSTSAQLCVRRAVRDFDRQKAVVLGTIEKFRSAESRCQAYVMRVGNAWLAATRAAYSAATGVAQADDPGRVSALLDRLDARWAKVDTAYARLNRACGD